MLGLLYVFLLGVTFIEQGIGVLGAETQDRLFGAVSNPLTGLFVGILATVLIQSSSASTSIIVGLVASGALTLDAAIPIVIGANMGTTVTSSLVAFGHVRQSGEFRRGLAAASIHDFFNLMAVIIMLPLELATGLLSRSSTFIAELLIGQSGTEFKSPIRTAVVVPIERFREFIERAGLPSGALTAVLIACGIALIVTALMFITKNMRVLMADRLERSLNAMLSRGGGVVAIVVGMIVTIAVQSSTITTAILVPLAASGVLSLRSVYPVTLGANIGTTVTALLAAMAVGRPEGLAIALVHTLYNVFSVTVIYATPGLRSLPIKGAEKFAEIATTRRTWAVVYIVGLFLVVPLVGIIIL